MIRYEISQRVHRTPSHVFDFVAVHQPENHPRWEPEVVEVRRPGPLAVGTRGVMVRREGGRTSEVPFEVVDLVPDRRIAFRSGSGGFHLHLIFDMNPIGDETEFVVTAELNLTGFLWLMTPIFARVFPRRSAAITARLASVLNEGRTPPPSN